MPERSIGKTKLLLCIFFFFLLNVTPLFADWEPDVRLTLNPDTSYTSYNNVWCVAASQDTIHVVWYDKRDGNWEIYYKRSTDCGLTWESDRRLTNDASFSIKPSVAVSGSNVYVMWYDNRDGNYEIYYKRSPDGGTNWTPDMRLTNNSSNSIIPSVKTLGPNVHIFWSDDRDGNYEIYYKRSTDYGTTWGSDTRLTNNSGFSQFPSVALWSQNIHVTWEDDRDGNYEIYYKRSPDNGTNWTPDMRLTDNIRTSVKPSIATSGSYVHVLWCDNRDDVDEIYYKRSTNDGVTWEPDIRLTTASAPVYWNRFPSVAVSDLNVHVVWHKNVGGNEIYYKKSTDGGSNWGTDTRLTNAPELSVWPTIAISGLSLHVVWRDYRDGNWEIYYKRNPTGNSGVEEESSQNIFTYLQISPNPFCEKTDIRFSLGYGAENVELEIYDVTGRLVKNFSLPTAYASVPIVISWDGQDNCGKKLLNGVYFLKFKAGDYIETKKLLLVR